MLQYMKRGNYFSKLFSNTKLFIYTKQKDTVYNTLNPLTFPGIIIHVNNENINKYEKCILKFLKTDIIGLDTEFMINFHNLKKFNYREINKKNLFFKNIQNKKIEAEQKPKKTKKEVKIDNGLMTADNCNKIKKNSKKYKNLLSRLFLRKKEKNILQTNEKTLCLIQLCSDNICFIFNIKQLNGIIPFSVKEILEDEKIIKVCHDVKNEKDLFLSQNIKIQNVFDLYNYAIKNFIYPPSLQNLVKLFLNRFLDKSFQLSNWYSDVLTEEQLIYAALDAYAARQIFDILKSKQLTTNEHIFNFTPDLTLFHEKEKEKEKKKEEKNIKTEIVSDDDGDDNTNIIRTYRQDKQRQQEKYENFENNKQFIINNLKKEIKNKCYQLNNVIFLEEVTFSNNDYKNVMCIQKVEHDEQLIKLYSHNYIEEEKCCRDILNFLDSKLPH